MVTLHPSFRRLVLKNIPKLKSEDLDNYDSLLALRLELVHRRSLVPDIQVDGTKPYEPDGQGAPPDEGKPLPMRPYGELPEDTGSRQETPRQKINRLITETTLRADKTIEPYREEFDALHRLWVARRNFALHQGSSLQIPSDPKDFWNFVKAAGVYHGVQLQTLPRVTLSRIKKVEWGRVLAVAVAAGLVLYGISQLELKDPGRDPQPPDSTIAR